MPARRAPVRMCVSCRGRFGKTVLTRYVASGGIAMEDPEQTMPGRGFYVCSSEECIKKMRRRLQRFSSVKMP